MSTEEMPTKRGKKSSAKAKRRKEIGVAYLFLAPYLVLLAMFGIIPVIYAFGLSFVDTIENTFYGLANYKFVLSDFRIGKSFLNVLHYLSIWLTGTVLLITALSLMLDSVPVKLGNALRTMYFLPGAVTSSAVVLLWLFMVDPTLSPFSGVLQSFGWANRQQVVNGISLAGLFSLMTFFSTSGGWIVVFGGALTSLPTEVKEAARVDGANGLQLALRIKLPMIWRSVVLMAILSFAAGLQLFVEPQLLNMAGDRFKQLDWAPNQLSFQYAFAMGDFGASAALSSMLLGLALIIALTIVFATNFYKKD